MKKFGLALLLLTATYSVAAKDDGQVNIFEAATAPVRPATDPMVKRLATDFQSYILKGTRYEQAMKDHELKRDKQTLRVTRSVKDCIKPGGLIDDEVQMCVNGTREKTW